MTHTRVALLLVALCTSGCAAFQQWPRITEGGAETQDIGPVVSYIASYFREPFPSGWRIRLVDRWIVRRQGDRVYIADGMVDPETHTIYVYAYDPCLAASSLPHEIMHVWGYRHEEKIQFRRMAKAQQAAIIALCGYRYQKREPPPPPTNLEVWP